MPSIEDLPLPEAVSLMKDGARYYFQNANGKPFYTYDRDKKNQSNCNDKCTESWEPVIAPAGETAMADWTVVLRDDKRTQWAYKGSPIYTNRLENTSGGQPDLSHDRHWHVLVP
jgi:predicted lipoprotein with Yx(FWY)xxD motif